MALQLSRYNYYFDTSNGFMIFNSFYSKLAIIKESFSAGETLISPQNLIKYLADNNLKIFLEDDLDNNILSQVKKNIYSRLENNCVYVKILTTYGCNMSCIYCYENNEYFSRENSTLSLTTEMSDRIIDFIVQESNKSNKKNIYLSWYGGEPLINYKPIIHISKQLKNLGLSLYSDITSNILLLKDNQELVNMLKESCVKMISVTLDGYGEYHNKRRPLKNNLLGINEYEETCKLIKTLSRDFVITVSIMINRENINHIDQIIDSLSGAANTENITVFVGMLENIGGCLTDELKNQTVTFSDLAYIRCKIYEKFWSAGFKTNLKFLLGMHGECIGTMNYSYVITPEGDILKCPDAIGNNELYVGKLDSLGSMVYQNSEWKWEYPLSDPKCSKCRMFPLCAGGCNYTYIMERMRNCQYYSENGVDIQNKEALEFSLKYYFLNIMKNKAL